MKTELCAEIRQPLKDSNKFRFSSGYAIGTELVLTCWHGLHDDSLDKSADIQITWRDVKGRSREAKKIKREDICWVNQDLDLALMRCQHPCAELHKSPQQILSSVRPQAKNSWESGGFLARLEDIEQERKFLSPNGKIKKTFEEQAHFELWCDESYVTTAALWAGFSGSPVFVANKIVGVVKAANDGVGGQELTAISIADLLLAEDDRGRGLFTQIVGWRESEERTCRQERQFEKMCETLSDQGEVLAVLYDELKKHLSSEALVTTDIESIIQAFNQFSDNQATNCIADVFATFCKQRKIAPAMVVGRFVEAWWPVLFEHDERLASFREDLSNPACTVAICPTHLAVPTELMMAEAEKRLIKLELSARNILISPMDLGDFAETGLNEEGEEQQRQLDELLRRRFLKATDQVTFDKFVDDVVYAIGRREDVLGELKGVKDKDDCRTKLADILNNLYDEYQWRFYFRFNADEDFDAEMIKPLKKRYPILAFLLSHCNDTRAEAGRYRRLVRVITATKSEGNLLKEFDKHAQ